MGRKAQDTKRKRRESTESAGRPAVRKAVEGGDKAAAQTVFSTSMSTIDSIADKKIIHKNKAARHKSRLSAAVKAMAA